MLCILFQVSYIPFLDFSIVIVYWHRHRMFLFHDYYLELVPHKGSTGGGGLFHDYYLELVPHKGGTGGGVLLHKSIAPVILTTCLELVHHKGSTGGYCRISLLLHLS